MAEHEKHYAVKPIFVTVCFSFSEVKVHLFTGMTEKYGKPVLYCVNGIFNALYIDSWSNRVVRESKYLILK